VKTNLYIEYHETLSSQAKSDRIYGSLHKTMAAGIVVDEDQPDRQGNRHAKRAPVENVPKIQKAAG
jgi:hypothetical protein